MSARPEPRRLVIVSNRLPFSVNLEDGRVAFHESAGGVVTGLRAYVDSLSSAHDKALEYIWVGWPGSAINADLQDEVKSIASSRYRSHPVFLSKEEMDLFYLGFCNKTIWPLFHYFSPYAVFDERHWLQYRHVNEVFADAVQGILRPGDILWIQDYHLMLLPGLLRSRAPSAPIGFFLHIPFPSYEVFRHLPSLWRGEILQGLLGADLIGFHTYGYTQHFLQCILRILGYENHLGQIALPDRIAKAETLPMGIDFDKFNVARKDPEVHKEEDSLRKSLLQVKTILSVDRLDYTKGILNRLHGFKHLLANNPSLHGTVVLLMIVVPSRIGVDQYDQMKQRIEELVSSINGQFSTVDWTPIIYQYRSVPFPALAALYSVSDVALVTPLRDGMNLVAKEYIASRTDESGVLVISEMAGAAKELVEAIVINPYDTQEIAHALHDALAMPAEEQRRRNQIMRSRLRRSNVVRWANDFIDQLLAIKQTQGKYEARLLSPDIIQKVQETYRKSCRRLFLLDYDGTLVSFSSRPELAAPGPDLVALLCTLAADPANTVVLISGREKRSLERWFGHLPLGLVAEHGAWIRGKEGEWKLLKQQTSTWKARILPILERYADRLPGAFVEEKDFSVVWHYRASHAEQGDMLARELTDHLMTFSANIDIQVLQGKKVVEVRNAGINKGIAGLHILSQESYDFVLAIGDDWTDEDLFASIPDSSFSIRVGITNSHARFNVRNVADVLALLHLIAGSADRQMLHDHSGTPPGRGERGAQSDTARRHVTSRALWTINLVVLPLAARAIVKIATSAWIRNFKR